jgi:hypothetical protein
MTWINFELDLVEISPNAGALQRERFMTCKKFVWLNKRNGCKSFKAKSGYCGNCQRNSSVLKQMSYDFMNLKERTLRNLKERVLN